MTLYLDGAGLTIYGSEGDKTLKFSGKGYQLNQTEVLNSTQH